MCRSGAAWTPLLSLNPATCPGRADFVLAPRVIARNCRPAVTQPAGSRAPTALVSRKERLRRKHSASAPTALVLAAELALQLLDLVLEARVLADLTIDLADRV